MEKVSVLVGSVVGLNNGATQDHTREVEFVGEELGVYREYGYDTKRGGLTDTRGVTQTLYRTEGGRLVMHVEDWSRWQGEPTTYSLREITEADLEVGGEFEALGAECGYGRPLTLNEAIVSQGWEVRNELV